jgi:HAD superfamily phosphatase
VKGVLVFDMDGVLVDVTESYRETIRETVRQFTGREITRQLIQDYKNQGGWNNDWALSQKICLDLGTSIEYDAIVERFQQIFIGTNNDGLILRERWVPNDGLLERLASRFHLAVFTGRPDAEAQFTLQRFVPHVQFGLIVADEHVRNKKPAPDGLLMIREQLPGDLWYVGDTVDDARAAKAAGDVRFIGTTPHAEVVPLLKRENAVAVLDNINELETVL